MKRQIVNIVNFVRGCEPRLEVDLVKPVKEQIRLIEEYRLSGTFLLQYDALVRPDITDLLRGLDSERYELGVWHEIVEEQAVASGIEWRGRYPWDWHTDCDCSVGYTKSERERLVDTVYSKFKEIFGYYPRVFGSWLFDTHTIRYISERYGIDAACNCKEQYGTDGYTLWGGYYGQGYYPSRNNVFLPASSREGQINVPIFRMLGSDPVYQYDLDIDREQTEPRIQSVITLEPACDIGGGSAEWTEWYMRENFNGECLSFGYTQVGQENSFGWEKMERGLTMQHALLRRLVDEGRITVECLGESGRFFKREYESTPASAITAHCAYDDPDKSSVWYSSSKYRINLYSDSEGVRIRDMHVFSDNFPDPFEDTVCRESSASYEALPVVDGNRNTGRGILAGIYPVYDGGAEPRYERMSFTDLGDNRARVDYGELSFTLSESCVRVDSPVPLRLELRRGIDGGHTPTVRAVSQKRLDLSYLDTDYSLTLSRGKFLDSYLIQSECGVIEINIE